MHPSLNAPTAGASTTPSDGDGVDPSLYDLGLSIESQVQCGLCLVLRLKTPAQMPALLGAIKDATSRVHEALSTLHYVHFARFVPTPDFSALLVITEFDGDPSTRQSYRQSMNSYLMDFVLGLGEVFNTILDFVDGAPRLPVQQYPRDFIAFVGENNLPISVWAASPANTVIEIQTATLRR